MPESITAVEIIRQSHQGISIKPFIVRGDDGASYFVKGLEKAGGPALISEVIGAELGKRMGLPIPDWKLMHVPNELISFSAIPNVTDLGGGLAFASRAVENASDFSVSNINHTPIDLRRRVLLFDLWVRNGDRCLSERGGNVNLILDGSGSLTVIDHNMAFDRAFCCNDFMETHVFRDCRSFFRDLVVRQEHMEILSDAVKNWGTITSLLPDDWLFRDRDQIDLTEPTVAERLEMLEVFKDERFWGEL
ncbi:hypothetical protein F3J45_00940 [Pantoea sp. Ap-967]|uniref:HipA family kinase n=1 Tax=Pantoea sp. Ap-967 TaxID=2608362 RepID=UPI00141ED360|nr:HipA family kinase [Pantoea sp. Ap-967]NIE73032.1 hypothetical protein [Pantoea sp. Ap-967]